MRDLGPREDGPQRVHHGDAQRVAETNARILLAVGNGTEKGRAHFRSLDYYYLYYLMSLWTGDSSALLFDELLIIMTCEKHEK